MQQVTSRIVLTLAVCCICVCGQNAAADEAGLIDFETLPGGTTPVDLQEISDQYSSLGVTFSLIDRETGAFAGHPAIAQVGLPGTAFGGCDELDTPEPGQSTGSFFLTDDDDITTVAGDLKVTYLNPVTQASGVILDVDCRVAGGPPCEQWTITARDSLGLIIETFVVDGPPGSPTECTINPDAGPGDGIAAPWFFDTGPERIFSIVFRYTGDTKGLAGLAFDNFSPDSDGVPLSEETWSTVKGRYKSPQ